MTDDSGALVSAIITTHNRSNLLSRAIDSVLAQTYPHLEIIVVDDGSRDGTEELVSRYRERCERLRYLRHDIPRGACSARNYGIREARGEFVAGLDDDDEWLPERVEKLLGSYRDEYAYVCSRDWIVYSDRMEQREKKKVITLKDMLYRNVTGNQILTRRERLLAVGGFDESLTSGQDYDMWLRLLERYGSARMLPEPLQKVYRDHLGERLSVSRGKIKGDWRLYNKHKDKMTKRQRKVRLMELRRLKGRSLRLTEPFSILSTGHFLRYLRYYLRRRLGRA
jgi:glycosyltransferase involved in cell wall biosynthesis